MSQKTPNYNKMMENDRRIAAENRAWAEQMKEKELQQNKEFYDRSEARLNAQEEYNRGQDQKRSDLFNDIVADGKFANQEIRNAYEDPNSWYSKQVTMEDMIKNDPTYEYRQQEMQDAAMRGINAGGNSLHGGAAMEALMEKSNAFSANNYDSYWNRQNIEKNQRMGLLNNMQQNGNFGLQNQAAALTRTDIGTQLTNLDGSVTANNINANNNYLQYLMAQNAQLGEKQNYYELQKSQQGGGFMGALQGGVSGFAGGFATTGNPWIGLGTGALGAFTGYQGGSSSNAGITGQMIGAGYDFNNRRSAPQNQQSPNPFMSFLGRA